MSSEATPSRSPVSSATSICRPPRVVDLGCGKGAVAIEIALELDLRVQGIELFQPFVEHAAGRDQVFAIPSLTPSIF